MAEERIRELEDRTIKMTQSKQQKENEQSLRAFWDYDKIPNIRVTKAPEGENKESRTEKPLERVMTKTSQIWKKSLNCGFKKLKNSKKYKFK